MKITIDRHHKENKELVFTITISEPHNAPFSEKDLESLQFLDKSIATMQTIGDPTSPINGQVCGAIHNIKHQTFNRVRSSMVFAIQQDIECKIHHICTEVYNWLFDNQPDYLSKWMMDFDPQRTKYYFHNDKTNDNADEEDDD